jgi:hypothetical protein
MKAGDYFLDGIFEGLMTSNKLRILFISKKGHIYGSSGDVGSGSTGLVSGAEMICSVLKPFADCKIAIVVDNNDIDKEVFNYQPNIVIIDALWAVPDKFRELIKLHPTVQWIVRIHSKLPFLAQEGIGFEWIKGYEKIGEETDGALRVAVNNKDFAEDLRKIGIKAIYLPNLYDINTSIIHSQMHRYVLPNERPYIAIGCFGAIRVLKNQLQQAVAAIIFAKKIHKDLVFYISDRVEFGGESVLKSLQHLFKEHPGAELIALDWQNSEAFKIQQLNFMDLNMQVSFSESFNIVTADAVSIGVPSIVSKDISWMPRIFQADPHDTNSIVRALNRAYKLGSFGVKLNKRALKRHNNKALAIWLDFIKDQKEFQSLVIP